MRTSQDPHQPRWTPADRNPVTLPQIGRVPAGLRYGVRPFGARPAPVPPPPPVDVFETRKGSRAGQHVAKPWTEKEDEKLVAAQREGVGFIRIARALGKSESACRKRFKRLTAGGGL